MREPQDQDDVAGALYSGCDASKHKVAVISPRLARQLVILCPRVAVLSFPKADILHRPLTLASKTASWTHADLYMGFSRASISSLEVFKTSLAQGSSCPCFVVDPLFDSSSTESTRYWHSKERSHYFGPACLNFLP